MPKLQQVMQEHLYNSSSEIYRENMRVKENPEHLPLAEGERVVVIPWSGGLDSTTSLIQAIESNISIVTGNVIYGQNYTRAETTAMAQISKQLKTDYPDLKKQWLKHLTIDVRKEYRRILAEHDGNWEHIFPFRNLIIIFKVIKETLPYTQPRTEYPELWFPSVQGEIPYSGGDKSRIFLTELQKVIFDSGHNHTLVTPLIGLAKADLIGWALEKPQRYNSIQLTYSCFEGTIPACGKCQACFRKATAFYNNDVLDELGFEINHKQMLKIARNYQVKFQEHPYYSRTRKETTNSFLEYLKS